MGTSRVPKFPLSGPVHGSPEVPPDPDLRQISSPVVAPETSSSGRMPPPVGLSADVARADEVKPDTPTKAPKLALTNWDGTFTRTRPASSKEMHWVGTPATLPSWE